MDPIISKVALPLSLALIMFSMGLGLTPADFKRVAVRPKSFSLGLFGQMFLLPIFAYIIAKLMNLSPELAVGIMILSCCPGGVTSNVYTRMAKGDIALSISLTAVVSVISMLTIPFIVNFSLSSFMGQAEYVSLPIGKTILGIFLMTTVPVIIGMVVRVKMKEKITEIENFFSKFSNILFFIIIGFAIFIERENVVNYFLSVGTAALVLNVSCILAGIFISRANSLTEKETLTISIECGLQNASMAILIATTFLNNQTMVIPGAIYGLIALMSGFAMVYVGRRGILGKELQPATEKA